MSARPSPGTSGQAASKSATGSYTQAKRQRRRNTQRSDSAVNGRSRSSVTADRKVELTAAVSLAATTGGLFFLADEGQDEGAAVRRGAVLEQEDALPSAELQPSVGDATHTPFAVNSVIPKRFLPTIAKLFSKIEIVAHGAKLSALKFALHVK